jgi:FdhD protein
VNQETNPLINCFVIGPGRWTPEQRELVGEEPLTIFVGDQPVATLMRTPGDEVELAMGFVLTEGIVGSPEDVGAISFCAQGGLSGRNEVRVALAEGARPRRLPAPRRVFSSCGVCGAEMIEEIAADIPAFARPLHRLAAEDLFALADAMRRGQKMFRRTGGTHAAALARPPVRPGCECIVREDLGRHNALDKAVGAAAQRGMLAPLDHARGGLALLLSGRLSFEMVAKAARAGISEVAGVSAPSALAVELARRLNMFLSGFVRERTLTVYSGADALRQEA